MLTGNGGINIDTGGFSAAELERLGTTQLASVLAAVRKHERRCAELPDGPRQHDLDLHASVRAITAAPAEGQ